jgi:hypothetical protein
MSMSRNPAAKCRPETCNIAGAMIGKQEGLASFDMLRMLIFKSNPEEL